MLGSNAGDRIVTARHSPDIEGGWAYVILVTVERPSPTAYRDHITSPFCSPTA
jgi:hypothetical protein